MKQSDIDKGALDRLVDFMSTNRNISKEEAEERIKKYGPKRLQRHGVLSGVGWREGYTKKSLDKRTDERRKKEKNRRKVRLKQKHVKRGKNY